MCYSRKDKTAHIYLKILGYSTYSGGSVICLLPNYPSGHGPFSADVWPVFCPALYCSHLPEYWIWGKIKRSHKSRQRNKASVYHIWLMWRVGFDVLYVSMMRRCLFADHRSTTHVSGRVQRKKKKKPLRGVHPVIWSPVGFYHTFVSYVSLFTTILRCTTSVTPCWVPLPKAPLPVSLVWKAPLQIGRMCKHPPPGRIRGPPTSSFLQPNLYHQRTILHDRRRGGFSRRVSSFLVAYMLPTKPPYTARNTRPWSSRPRYPPHPGQKTVDQAHAGALRNWHRTHGWRHAVVWPALLGRGHDWLLDWQLRVPPASILHRLW